MSIRIGIAIEDDVAIELSRRIEFGVRNIGHESVATVPPSFRIQPCPGRQASGFLRGAPGSVDQQHIVVEGIAKRSGAMGALQVRRRTVDGRPAISIPVKMNAFGIREPGDRECAAIQLEIQGFRMFVHDRGIQREPGHIVRAAFERSVFPVQLKIDSTGLQCHVLCIDSNPVACRRTARINCREPDPVDLTFFRKLMILEESEQCGPVHALITPPVSGSGFLVVGPVRMEIGEDPSHFPGLFDWNRFIRIAMEDVDPELIKVFLHQEGVTWIGGTVEYFLHATIPFISIRTTIGPEGDPAGTWCDGRPLIRQSCSKLPGSMATHGMSCQPTATGVVGISLGSVFKDFHGIHSTPVLPIESEWSTIGRCHDMDPVS